MVRRTSASVPQATHRSGNPGLEQSGNEMCVNLPNPVGLVENFFASKRAIVKSGTLRISSPLAAPSCPCRPSARRQRPDRGRSVRIVHGRSSLAVANCPRQSPSRRWALQVIVRSTGSVRPSISLRVSSTFSASAARPELISRKPRTMKNRVGSSACARSIASAEAAAIPR
jgi:hypothetical protein